MTNGRVGFWYLDTRETGRLIKEVFVCLILIYSIFTVGAHIFHEGELISDELYSISL